MGFWNWKTKTRRRLAGRKWVLYLVCEFFFSFSGLESKGLADYSSWYYLLLVREEERREERPIWCSERVEEGK